MSETSIAATMPAAFSPMPTQAGLPMVIAQAETALATVELTPAERQLVDQRKIALGDLKPLTVQQYGVSSQKEVTDFATSR
jgi:hypothetical protein